MGPRRFGSGGTAGRPERGFQDPGMNSFNHYSLGSCGQWLFDSAAGIGLDPEQPGFRHIIIHPRVGGGLTSASASLRSIRGLIASSWAVKDGDVYARHHDTGQHHGHRLRARRQCGGRAGIGQARRRGRRREVAAGGRRRGGV